MELQNVIMLLLLTINLAVAQNTSREEAQELHVGVILDLGSIVGKMARTSVSLAMEDFYAVHRNYSTKLVLHIRDSMSDDVQAASQGTCSQLLGHCISSFCYAGVLHQDHRCQFCCCVNEHTVACSSFQLQGVRPSLIHLPTSGDYLSLLELLQLLPF
uniref:Receptor ligand binding region domain-containing protein n=1 Tax=Aegilops tauschii subsp. strangulata TaxID=200361 RepID=A0A453KVY3_AEGTS